MNIRNFLFFLFAFAAAGCGHTHEEAEEHEDAKFQYTAYNHNFELFAEADPFIVGETANVLSHFTMLPEFRPLENGKIKIALLLDGKEMSHTLNNPTRNGIYSFDIKPETAGKGTLRFLIEDKNGNSELTIAGVSVFSSHEEAHEAAEAAELNVTNTTVFTKEQSWKVDFSTDHPEKGPFGQVIKTIALLKPSPESEMVITAKTNGIVSFSNGNLAEGREVPVRQVLFTISGGEFAENNFSVRYAEAKNNFEKARADYERAKELSADKIVSEKDLLNSRIQYDNTKAIYDNLNRNFSASGQNVTSPMSGYIKQVFVKNGSYVEAGEPVLAISQDKTLILTADIQQKYASLLGSIQSADIRTVYDDKVYTLEQLNGKVISYGKSANSGSYLIPVTLQIENRNNFTPGTFVEVYLKTITNLQAVTVPNSALMEEQSNYFVYVQVTPELFEKREVSVGTTDGFRTEILGGVTENDRIVIKGAILIKITQSTGTLDAHSGHVH